MQVESLNKIEFEELLDCFLKAFEGYFVKMPTDPNYYRDRWRMAKVDYRLSYGMFDQGNLIGFIINAVDRRYGEMIAYNTGTGVLPEYRGRRMVKSIYEYALPDLKRNGITKCTLEVIVENIIAIKSYKSIGFEIGKTYQCFNGNLIVEDDESVSIREVDFSQIDWEAIPNQDYYSWDNQVATIESGNYKYYHVFYQGSVESFFAIDPESGYIPQFELFKEGHNGCSRFFTGIGRIYEKIKINNIDVKLKSKIEYLNSIGIINVVDQFEMEMKTGRLGKS